MPCCTANKNFFPPIENCFKKTCHISRNVCLYILKSIHYYIFTELHQNYSQQKKKIIFTMQHRGTGLTKTALFIADLIILHLLAMIHDDLTYLQSLTEAKLLHNLFTSTMASRAKKLIPKLGLFAKSYHRYIKK